MWPMSEKRFLLTFAFLLWGLFSAVGQSTQSPKAVILEKLTSYQQVLQEAKSLIDSLTLQTSSLSIQIQELEQKLQDSNNSSQEIVKILTLELEESRRQLLISQAALADQQTVYRALLMAYENLERSLRRSRRLAFASSFAAVVLFIIAL